MTGLLRLQPSYGTSSGMGRLIMLRSTCRRLEGSAALDVKMCFDALPTHDCTVCGFVFFALGGGFVAGLLWIEAPLADDRVKETRTLLARRRLRMFRWSRRRSKAGVVLGGWIDISG